MMLIMISRKAFVLFEENTLFNIVTCPAENLKKVGSLNMEKKEVFIFR